MGLLDWLMANAKHPKAKELLDAVIAVRADLIRSDNELSFFEVRTHEDCIRDDYARIFEMVLDDLIRQYYGVEVTRKQADAHADMRINMLNSNIIRINREETWDPVDR